MGNKHSVSDRDVNNFSQSASCTDGRDVNELAVELKYQQPLARMVH